MYRYILTSTSALDGVGGQRHALAALPPERPSTHCIASWVHYRLSSTLLNSSPSHTHPVTHTLTQ